MPLTVKSTLATPVNVAVYVYVVLGLRPVNAKQSALPIMSNVNIVKPHPAPLIVTQVMVTVVTSDVVMGLWRAIMIIIVCNDN